MNAKASSRNGCRTLYLAPGIGLPSLGRAPDIETLEVPAFSGLFTHPAHWAERIQFLSETES